jgi:hypothetical protein
MYRFHERNDRRGVDFSLTRLTRGVKVETILFGNDVESSSNYDDSPVTIFIEIGNW